MSWELASLAASETSKCSCVNISFLLRNFAFSALKKANSSSIPDLGDEVDDEATDIWGVCTNAGWAQFCVKSS